MTTVFTGRCLSKFLRTRLSSCYNLVTAMKREIFIRLAFLISFFVLLSVVKNWLTLAFWPLWLGGVIGMILPCLDHLIYVFFLAPYELTSQRVIYLVKNKNFLGAFRLLFDTRGERTNLIFHSFIFQIIIFLLAFWLITSSGNLLGKGIMFGLLLHLVIDRFTVLGLIFLLVLGIFA